MRIAALLLADFLALTTAALGAQQTADVLHQKDGPTLRGIEIVACTPTVIRYRRGALTAEVPAPQVSRIDWGQAPPTLARGLAALARGEHGNAAELFAAAAATRSSLASLEARFLQAKAVAASNIAAENARAFDLLHAFLATGGDHWRLPEAMLLLAEVEARAGNDGAADGLLRELAVRAEREAWGAVWTVRAQYQRATLLSRAKPTAAAALFESTAAAADGLAAMPSDRRELRRLRLLALAGQGESWLAAGSAERARTHFQGLLADADDAVIATGLAGLGEIDVLAAAGGGDRAALPAAWLLLARASVRDHSNGDASAKANYYLGRCLALLGPDLAGEGARARSQAYLQSVVRNHGDSRWAALARAELRK